MKSPPAGRRAFSIKTGNSSGFYKQDFNRQMQK
jgi:hypothetical protein